ncbi:MULTISPECIES: sterol desaturase family protein [Alkalimonas]|uniref:Sterol desaturase family protein n=1 Tax=Alkalimonas mucilaginosa TaxID=3057676 RepID=A0ABU7JHS8_9GAMM|nr:sterol desaturase family protein [Alkalimonas sp. MEB004]MEE2024903.1 sterol desaturase family protein [Alkalimonas sp. MEB004]
MQAEWILLALSPVFLTLVALECWYGLRLRLDWYQWRDTLANAALALMHQAAELLTLLLLLPFYWWLFQYRLLDIPLNAWTLLLAFLMQDFLYYWFHRASHHIRWFWASHIVHHSSRHLNFSTAFRQSLMYPVSGMWLFWLPMMLLGFSPWLVLAVVALNLAFQFFVHTQAVQKLGWLEWVLNTPSHHRVHHASNSRYIDKNFGGVLILWDKLFGTFAAESSEEACRYGITTDFQSYNPLIITFDEWRLLWLDWRQAKGWRRKLAVLVAAPAKAVPSQAQAEANASDKKQAIKVE